MGHRTWVTSGVGHRQLSMDSLFSVPPPPCPSNGKMTRNGRNHRPVLLGHGHCLADDGRHPHSQPCVKDHDAEPLCALLGHKSTMVVIPPESLWHSQSYDMYHRGAAAASIGSRVQQDAAGRRHGLRGLLVRLRHPSLCPAPLFPGISDIGAKLTITQKYPCQACVTHVRADLPLTV